MRASACAAAIYDSSFMGNWLASSLGLRASPFVQSLRGGAASSVIARSAAFSVMQPILSLRGAKPRGNLHLRGDRFVTLAMTAVRRGSRRPFGARDDKQA